MRSNQPNITFGSLEDRIESQFKNGNAITEEEYRLRHREQDRLDKHLEHTMLMERLSFGGICVAFIAGIYLYNTSAEKTLGIALITGPAGALIERNATLSSKKKTMAEKEE